MDYSKGRYTVRNNAGQIIGRIDEDEFVRNGATLLYRLEGNDVYEVGTDGKSLAFIRDGQAVSPSGQVLFAVDEE